MRYWRVKRGEKVLGDFLAERLELRDGSLMAMRGKRVVGSVASGPDLSWKPIPFAGTIWRVGKKVPLNVYEGDRPVCQCHNAEDARRIVDRMNTAEKVEEPPIAEKREPGTGTLRNWKFCGTISPEEPK